MRRIIERGARTAGRLALAGACTVAVTGCVTVAEFRKLEDRVAVVERSGAGDPESREALATTNAEMDALRAELEQLRGRLEVAEKVATDARVDARKARQELARQSAAPGAAPEPDAPPLSEEVRAYRDAYAAWRGGDHQQCIDKFGSFLQSYPDSAEADDAMFWMADCSFKSGDYKYAVLRFDDVVNKYPDGDKAPDALYRQGEALLALGHQEAAIAAFERLLSQYPKSELTEQARRRLAAARAG